MSEDTKLINRVAVAIDAQFDCGPAKAWEAARAAVAAYEAYQEIKRVTAGIPHGPSITAY